MNNEFGKRFNEFRKFKRLGQVEMAEIIGGGVKQANISTWEKGHMPEGATMQLIQDAFPDLNKKWLLSGDGEMLKDPDVSGWDKKYYALLEKYTVLLEKLNNVK